MRLESPAITLPGAANLSPRLTFEHYFATEAGWDGGNLKISINGGAFAVVPATAFSFNPYNGTLNTAAAGNTNPLAGQPGFTGTDGGEVHGSWGHVADRPDQARRQGGRHDQAPLRLRHGRLHRRRRLVRRRRQGASPCNLKKKP